MTRREPQAESRMERYQRLLREKWSDPKVLEELQRIDDEFWLAPPTPLERRLADLRDEER